MHATMEWKKENYHKLHIFGLALQIRFPLPAPAKAICLLVSNYYIIFFWVTFVLPAPPMTKILSPMLNGIPVNLSSTKLRPFSWLSVMLSVTKDVSRLGSSRIHLMSKPGLTCTRLSNQDFRSI